MIKKRISLIISTVLGVGYFPFMPGTIGTIAAFAIYHFLLPDVIFSSIGSNLIFIAAVLVSSVLVIPFINESEKELGHDSGKIVIDEVFGYFIAISFLPVGLITALAGFVFFRIFDIAKPEPVNKLQSLPGGWGVMADDIMAGVYANICCQILIRLIIK